MTIWNNPASSLPLLPTPTSKDKNHVCWLTDGVVQGRWVRLTLFLNEWLSEWMKPGLSWWSCMQRGHDLMQVKLGLPILGREIYSFWPVLAVSYFNPETDGLCVLCCSAFQGNQIRLSSRALDEVWGCCLAHWWQSFTRLPCSHRCDSAISITAPIAHT